MNLLREHSYVQEAINTLNAGWFELKLAKIFGKTRIECENGRIIHIKEWNKKFYLINRK